MSATLKRSLKHDFEITVSGKELAELFSEMNSGDQAIFFNNIFNDKGLENQMKYVGESAFLHEEGRIAMRIIGDSVKR